MTKIAILTGGTSEERDIALASAGNVAKVLEGSYDATTFDFPGDIDAFLSRRAEFAVAIPVFHGKGGEDGTVQGFLETVGVPYLFSGIAALAVGMDKQLAKRAVASAGMRTAAWTTVVRGEAAGDVAFPCVVKPLDGGSTQGVTVAHDRAGLDRALEAAFMFSPCAIVEDFVAGDEFTVAVAEDLGESVALPVIQIKAASGIYDYAAKYGPQPAVKLCPAPIADDLASSLQAAALTAHKTIGARHLSRTDFIVDSSGTIWFLEINTIPGLSVLFPRAVAASGRDFGTLLAQWVDSVARA